MSNVLVRSFLTLISSSLQTEASIYAEIDKLSAAWEALDKQVQSKVFDLSVMEDKFSKVIAEVSNMTHPRATAR